MELTVRVHFEDDAYWAEVVELPGCFASGETLDELKDALDEAIAMYLEGRLRFGSARSARGASPKAREGRFESTR